MRTALVNGVMAFMLTRSMQPAIIMALTIYVYMRFFP